MGQDHPWKIYHF